MRGVAALVAFLFLAMAAQAGAASTVRLATQDEEAPLQVRPATIGYTGDGTGYLGGRGSRPRAHLDRGGLHWLHWGRRSALAHGWDWLNDCRPDCAGGHFHPFPAIVRARRPRHGLFTRLTIETRLGGRWRFDHRKLGYTPPQQYGEESFPAFWFWEICGNRYTSPC